MDGESKVSLSPDAPNTSKHDQTNSGSSNTKVVDLTDDLGTEHLKDDSVIIVVELNENDKDECTSQRVDMNDRNLSIISTHQRVCS